MASAACRQVAESEAEAPSMSDQPTRRLAVLCTAQEEKEMPRKMSPSKGYENKDSHLTSQVGARGGGGGQNPGQCVEMLARKSPNK